MWNKKKQIRMRWGKNSISLVEIACVKICQIVYVSRIKLSKRKMLIEIGNCWRSKLIYCLAVPWEWSTLHSLRLSEQSSHNYHLKCNKTINFMLVRVLWHSALMSCCFYETKMHHYCFFSLSRLFLYSFYCYDNQILEIASLEDK